MADQTTESAAFQSAKERARKAMLDARANATNDAKAAENQQQESEDDEETQLDTPPDDENDDGDEEKDSSAEDEAEDDEESDDDDDDERDESDDDEESSDDEDDDEADESQKSKKRKPNRRSKKVQKLSDKIKELEASAANAEERLLERIKQEQARSAALEREKQQREAEDRAIEAEMAEYLGSDQEYRAAIKAALNGDFSEAEKARAWDERREIFAKLTRRAETMVNEKAAEIYWSVAESLPGVDKDILGKATFGDVLKHLHEAGARSVEGNYKKEIEKRDAQIARLTAQAKSSKVKKAASAPKPVLEGGTSVKPRPEKSIYAQSMKPGGGIDREKFDELRRRAQQQRNLA